MKLKKLIYFCFVFACGALFANEYYKTINEVQEFYKKQYSEGSIAYKVALNDIERIVVSDLSQSEKIQKLRELLPHRNNNFFVKNDFSWKLKNISIAYKVGAEWSECFSYTENASMSTSLLSKVASGRTTTDKDNVAVSSSLSVDASAGMKGILPKFSAKGSIGFGISVSGTKSTVDVESAELSAAQKRGLDNLAQQISSKSVKLSDIFLQVDVEFYNGTDRDLEIPPTVGLEFGSGFMFLERQSGVRLPKGRSTIVIYKTALGDTAKLGIVDFIKNDGKPSLDLEKSGISIKNQYNEDLISNYMLAKANIITVSLSSNGELTSFNINSNCHETGKVSLSDIVENLNKTVYNAEILSIKDGCLIINGVSSKPEKNSEWIVSIKHNNKYIPNTKVSQKMELKNGDSLTISVDSFVYCFNKDIDLDKEVVEQYASKKNAAAECFIGGICIEDKNYKEALKWFKKSAEQGNAYGQCMLGAMYYKGEEVEQDYKEALKWFKKSAEQGNAYGQWLLGTMYASGEGVEQDYTEALKWLKKSAEQGDADAQCVLGTMYASGEGVEQNYTEALKWLKKSAEQGNADAQFALGTMYYNGKGVEQNYKEACKRLKKSAEQGNAYGQCLLGTMYYNGKGVEQNYKEAFKWFKKSSEQGNADAQCWLGAMCYYGEGIEQNYTEAFKWFKKSAEQGDASAQYSLYVMYISGYAKYPEIDFNEAMEWLEKAAKQGHELAKKTLYEKRR